ncbi:MAG: TolC family protein [Pirellulaceae bacterium]
MNFHLAISSRWHEAVFGFTAILVATLLLPGCRHSRAQYREQADRVNYDIIAEKVNDPRWDIGDFRIQPPSDSRMFDPNRPDHPPMPLDDPASNRYMQIVDDKYGYWGWEKNGVTADRDNPAWMAYLPLNEKGELILTSDRTVELARLHSPDYQQELEDLYLTALDVNFERFRFDAQFFGGIDLFYTADGRLRSPGPGSSSRLDVDSGIQMQKLGATGSEFVVGLANTLMWEFSGPNTDSVNTLLDFTLIQPLLRGGGRRVVLEQLTQRERDLLANVRQMQRFNQAFYLEVVAGRTANIGPNRGGGFPPVGPTGRFNVGGYMGLLQQEQNIRNQESNIAALRSSLAQLEAFFEAGRIDSFQVELTRQSLFREQSSLLTAKANFQDTLDRYKLQLGLPPEVEARLGEDEFFAQYNLIDPAFTPVSNYLNDVQVAVGNILLEVLPDPEMKAEPALDPLEVDPAEDVPLNNLALPPELVWDEEVENRLRELQAMIRRIQTIVDTVDQDFFPLVRRDVQQFEELLPLREADLRTIQNKLANYEREEEETIPEEAVSSGVLSVARLQRLPPQLDQIMADLTLQFASHQENLRDLDQGIEQLLLEGPELEPSELFLRAQQGVFNPVPDELNRLISDVLGLSLVQARARTESITLVPVDIDSDTALEVARFNRLDWMNARAALVDSWRSIEVVANALEADLDIVFSGDIGTVGDNPVDFRSTTGRLRVGLQWDAPLTRVVERNAYREAQINYQRTRRSYYQFRDEISRGLRDTIRTLELNQINFELRRAAVQVAISQVERTQLRLQEPAKPNQDGVQFDSSTARDLINALDSLLAAQNDFLSVGVDYEILRRGLDVDMGTIQLDPSGIWIDPGPVDGEFWRRQIGKLEAEEQSELGEELISPRAAEQLPDLESTPLENVPPAAPPLENAPPADQPLDVRALRPTAVEPAKFENRLR